ncbi:DNA polymerase zeta catalytic subunit [Reticulomyxa filosa]|uniref:DNA polymerase zeta catalytic subunit n=1 Tax=Reticulomyxa filosa TaxID=46433 RepID=X6MIL9_RETFI|nr:DNA polymerase zeta catalytic subunit [Reticulomyxa filosa]|eukprot:ETO12875.1 DNA polymerase zeta catalytic subunit [Reticulomyxa filosa]
MCKPLDNLDVCLCEFSGKELRAVPVIRIYGNIVSNGVKTCLHIHRYFPYLLVKIPATHVVSFGLQDLANAKKYAYEFALQLHNILSQEQNKKKVTNLNNNNNNNNNNDNNNNNNNLVQSPNTMYGSRDYVYKVSIVSALDFYGHYNTLEPFIKITCIHPSHVKWIAHVCSKKYIKNCVFQCYESHIPYLLHFLIDHNLFGMNSVHLQHWWVRQPLTLSGSSLHDQMAPTSRILSNNVPRQSYCEFEIDALASNILNVQQLIPIVRSDLHSPLFDMQIKLVPSLKLIWDWEHPKKKKKKKGLQWE